MPQPLLLRRYAHADTTGWQGVLEPADRSWILFSDLDGRPRLFLLRARGGATLPASVPAGEVLQ
jgi:hypothetical protein